MKYTKHSMYKGSCSHVPVLTANKLGDYVRVKGRKSPRDIVCHLRLALNTFW